MLKHVAKGTWKILSERRVLFENKPLGYLVFRQVLIWQECTFNGRHCIAKIRLAAIGTTGSKQYGSIYITVETQCNGFQILFGCLPSSPLEQMSGI